MLIARLGDVDRRSSVSDAAHRGIANGSSPARGRGPRRDRVAAGVVVLGLVLGDQAAGRALEHVRRKPA